MIINVTNKRKIKDGFIQSYYINDTTEVLLSEIRKDTDLDKHHHQHEQFGYCFTGEFLFNVETTSYNIGKSQSYLLGADIHHGATAISDFYALDYKYITANTTTNDSFTMNILKDYDDGIVKEKSVELNNADFISIQSLMTTSVYKKEFHKKTTVFLCVNKKMEITINNQKYCFEPMNIYKVDVVNVMIVEFSREQQEVILLCLFE